MTTSSSAALAEAERTIKKLEEENSRIKNELHETKSLYSQLVLESGRESFDERRVLLLKSQLIQFERQILLLNEALSSRANVQLDIEVAMLDVADRCRKYIGVDNKRSEVSIPRSELMRQVEQVESVRLKLSKSIENNSSNTLAKPLLLMDGFVKTESREELSLFDVCSGKLDHLNLKHVSKLENELSCLYQQLITLEKSLAKALIRKHHHDPRVHMSKPEMERQYLATQKAVDLAQACCEQLLSLSILVPAAPLPAFKSKLKGLTTERVLSSLPTTVRNKQDTKQVVESLLKSMNYTIHMKSMEVSGLTDELKFHQSVYELQCQYMDDLFEAMKLGYGRFENNAMECLVIPLEDVFEKYEVLKNDASEGALREFLTTFKSNAESLQSAVVKMRPNSSEERAEVLSAYGEEFFADLAVLQNECAEKRDQFLADLEIVKKQRDEHAEQLEVLLQSAQPEKNQAKVDYERVITTGDCDDDDIDLESKRRRSSETKYSKPNKSVETVQRDCIGCKEDEASAVAEKIESSKRKVKKVTAGPAASRMNDISRTTPEPRLPRTPISGSSIPRTPSSNIPARRVSNPDTRSRALPTNPSPNSTLPIRNLKLKK